MTDLITRIEAGTGADRELDALLWALADGRTVRDQDNMVLARNSRPPHDECVLGYIDPGKHSRNFMTAGQQPPLPRYTVSLDAAIALTERLLPEAHGWQFTIYHDGAQVSFLGKPPTLQWGRSKSRPRALLAATLRAHAALKETSDAE